MEGENIDIKLDDEDIDLVRLRTDYPFLTYLQLGSQGILGIMQNETSHAYMMYDLAAIRTGELRALFLKCGEEWWWESNAEMPIESFIGRRFDVFRQFLKGYIKKDIVRVVGPRVNLAECFNKRIKKKKIGGG